MDKPTAVDALVAVAFLVRTLIEVREMTEEAIVGAQPAIETVVSIRDLVSRVLADERYIVKG